jgi:hypothetical protein
LTGRSKTSEQREKLSVARRGKKNTDATSAYRGVHWHAKNRYWEVGIYPPNIKKKRYIGVFHDEEEAARAYDKVAREIFGNGAKLNFPEAFEEKTP